MKQNITIALDRSVVKKAKVLAAERSTSISQMLADEVERMVGERDRYAEAKRQAIAELRRGYRLGGGALPRREGLHER